MKKAVLTLVVILTLNMKLSAQEQWKIKTKHLAQSGKALVFKPESYNPKMQYPLVYLLHGYSESYLQWSSTVDCQALANRYNMIIVCPEGFVSYYINSPYDDTSQYEDFFFNDLAPKVHSTFNIDKKNIFISGLSMGGYGALRYFILHPDYFNTAGATSGALDIDFVHYQKVSQAFWSSNRMTDDLISILGDPVINNWNNHSIITLLKNRPSFQRAFIFDAGEQDIIYSNSVQLKVIADSLRIPVTFISQPGEHNMEYWSKSIEHHFIYFKQHLKK